MADKKGRLIVLEGIDGSGKSTQYELLKNRLSAEGREFRSVRFPRYSEPSSSLIRMYLAGEFGSDPESVNPYAASAFFAVDRFASYAADWRAFYEAGGLILADRYTTSNAIHQGSKLERAAREDFFKWLYDFEFRLMELPAPDEVIYIDLPVSAAVSRLRERERSTGSEADIHEADADYLEKCRAAGLHAAEFFGWRVCRAYNGSESRTADDIHREIYAIIMGG